MTESLKLTLDVLRFLMKGKLFFFPKNGNHKNIKKKKIFVYVNVFDCAFLLKLLIMNVELIKFKN